ncbi:MAG: pyridoxal phosphate-dependent aminotransferase family protein [Verrucomicrobiota bacterium]
MSRASRTLAAPLQLAGRTAVDDGQRELLYFGGCDYYRFSRDRRLLAVLRRATVRYGLSVCASRTTTGNHPLYGELEVRLADFFGAPRALVLPSGYGANLAVAEALRGQVQTALIDAKAHYSLWSAADALGCDVVPFHHRDPEDLLRALRWKSAPGRVILLTDGMFSLTGHVAPLRDYLAVLPRQGVVLVDDAHAAGVLGAHGQGTLEAQEVDRVRVIQTITLSKALGCYGGAVLGSSWLCDQVAAKSAVRGQHSIPLPLAAMARAALDRLKTDPSVENAAAEMSPPFAAPYRRLVSQSGSLKPNHCASPARPADRGRCNGPVGGEHPLR